MVEHECRVGARQLLAKRVGFELRAAQHGLAIGVADLAQGLIGRNGGQVVGFAKGLQADHLIALGQHQLRVLRIMERVVRASLHRIVVGPQKTRRHFAPRIAELGSGVGTVVFAPRPVQREGHGLRLGVEIVQPAKADPPILPPHRAARVEVDVVDPVETEVRSVAPPVRLRPVRELPAPRGEAVLVPAFHEAGERVVGDATFKGRPVVARLRHVSAHRRDVPGAFRRGRR